MGAGRASRESCSRPLPRRSHQEATDALRSSDGTAAGDDCKASPAGARRPAQSPRSPPRPAVPPPLTARGGGRAPPGSLAAGREPLAAAAPHAYRHEVGRGRLVAHDLGLDGALDLLEAGDLRLQLLGAALELGDPELHP